MEEKKSHTKNERSLPDHEEQELWFSALAADDSFCPGDCVCGLLCPGCVLGLAAGGRYYRVAVPADYGDF